jgi:alpha-1,2-mannosyltransferase
MSVSWFYLIHLAGFASGAAVLEVLRRRGVSWSIRVTVGALMCAAMAAFVFRISEPPDLFSDFYKAYYPAAKAILSHKRESGLEATMRQGAGGFVNLPILAWLFAPFAKLKAEPAGFVFFFSGVLATIGAWFSLSRLARLDRDRSLLLLFVFAACGPLHNSLREGNTTHFILLLLVLGLWALRRKLDLIAGVIFGFAALIKLPLLLLGVYFVARGRWKVAMGGTVIGGLAVLLSLLVFGWDLHVYWYEHSIKPFAGTPLAAFNVQSVQGFLARLQYGGSYLEDWKIHPLNPVIMAACKLAAVLLLGLVAVVIGWPRRWRSGGLPASENNIVELETCIVVMLALMISTVSWSHYYLWMLLPAALLIGGTPPALASRGGRVAGWLALVGALPPVLIVHPANPVLGNIHGYFAVSHFVLSAGLLLAVFLVAHWRAARPEPSPSRT